MKVVFAFVLELFFMILIVAESNPFNILDHFDKSNDISRYAIFPLFLLLALIYLMMNFYLLWKWHTSGEFDTNVNKLIGIQRTIGIFYSLAALLTTFSVCMAPLFCFFPNLPSVCAGSSITSSLLTATLQPT